MNVVNITEGLLVKALEILSKMFAITMEPVKIGKIPELNKPEIRKSN